MNIDICPYMKYYMRIIQSDETNRKEERKETQLFDTIKYKNSNILWILVFLCQNEISHKQLTKSVEFYRKTKKLYFTLKIIGILHWKS